MIFTTWSFLVFMAAVLVVYWWLTPARWRRACLLLASLVYFTYNFPLHTLLLGGLTLSVYGLGRVIVAVREQEDGRKTARTALIAGLVLCAGTLAFFKYSRMIVGIGNGLLHEFDYDRLLPEPRFLVPLGISFFTFEFIHYLTDVYHGRAQRGSLLEFSLFAFFFPSLVSGPIKRFQIFREQAQQNGSFRAHYLDDGLRRVTMGIFKKIVIADTAGLFTTALSHPHGSTRTAIWIAMYAYAVKIYYDFSGFTDIAIGLGQMLGYRLPENFNKPYRQPDLSRFWNNWHMSLSSWIRDYLFIPLGGSRCGKARTLFNLTVVMAICGLWHGANWNFVVWGLWQGLGLAVLRLYRPLGSHVPDSRPVRWAGTAVTFQYICFGWVLFAAPSLPVALACFGRMVGRV